MEIEIKRKEIYDPNKEEYVRELLPTKSVKKLTRDTGSMSAGELLASHYIGAGSVLRVTRVRIFNSGTCEYLIADRNGSIDIFAFSKTGGETLLGAPLEPVYIAEGTIRVRAIGSVAEGTRVISFEGISESRILGNY